MKTPGEMLREALENKIPFDELSDTLNSTFTATAARYDAAREAEAWNFDLSQAPKDETRYLITCGKVVTIGYWSTLTNNLCLLSAAIGEPIAWRPLPAPPAARVSAAVKVLGGGE